MENRDSESSVESRSWKKDVIGFWIFGLCNNYGYVVMLTAALDIIKENTEFTEISYQPIGRNCTKMSTATVLIADIVPSFIIKTLSPFLPYNATYRVIIACALSAISFFVVAFASSTSAVIFGVSLTSLASGLGEPTFLAHSTHYESNCVSSWSSGTGGAGIIGALTYSILRGIGFSGRQTLLAMTLVPAIEIYTFFFILSKPRTISREQEDIASESSPLVGSMNLPPLSMTVSEKLKYIPKLMPYIVPLTLVYFFEYFVNQGLLELIIFPNNALTTEQQYRWYQVTYQIGVFLSRSSVNVIKIRRTWIMAVIQGLLAIFFLNEAIFLFVPSIEIVFVMIFVEGLQGGLAYVNTYYNLRRDVAEDKKALAMNVVACSDSIGITFAGFFAMRAHSWICQLPDASMASIG